MADDTTTADDRTTADDPYGPSGAPPRTRLGLVATLVEVVRLPLDLLRALVVLVRLPVDVVLLLGYLVREAPELLRDVRSTVNDVARLVHHGERGGALQELLDELARAARADSAGSLTHLLRSAGDLAAARAESERRRLAAGVLPPGSDGG
ncbi:hypothetical protein [uncultured Pseudokineococcus sp.]|uniref:hypothetical protein n=1 Tax=uncultured Pseudokineococcus sp. TaxID=1642928 RepID=UPI002636DA6C|nr:hypothetical protein [uncultured Pseudokineococcus sp.]